MTARGRATPARVALVSLLVLAAARALGQDSGCTSTASYLGVREAQAGTLFQFEGDTSPRVTRESSAELSLGGDRLYWAVVEFAGAENKTGGEPRDLVEGDVARVRAAPYRRGAECGVRLYVELRRPVTLALERVPLGFLLARSAAPAAGSGAPSPARRGEGGLAASGGGLVSAFFSPSRFGDDSLLSGTLGIGLYQEVFNTGWIRGFMTHYFTSPGRDSTYGALGLFGYPIRAMRLDVATGDATVPFAVPLQDAAITPFQLLIRGGSVSLRQGRRFQLWAFYGRSATPDALRIAGTTELTSDISDDSVGGVFGYLVRGPLTLGAGWVLSMPRDLPRRSNFFEQASFAFTEALKVGAVAEESLGERTGWQTTLAPNLKGSTFYVTGYFRYASPDFTPALGSNYFAGLRRAYQLAGAYRILPGLTLGVAAGQTRTFNLFDPPSVGTTTEFGDASLQAALSRNVTAGLFFRSTRTMTDAGALNPADSRTNSFGLNAGTVFGLVGVSAALSRDDTTDALDPTQGFRSTRVTLNVRAPIRNLALATLQGSYADSRRTSGASAGRNYTVSLALDRQLARNLSGGLIVAEDVRPAGVATFASTSTRVGAHAYWLGPAGFQAGASLAYQRLNTDGGEAVNGYYATLNVAKSFGWGPRRAVFADAGARAFNMQEPVPDAQFRGTIELHAFVDENSNGRQDSGERGLEGIGFEIDGDTYRTDAEGAVRVFVLPGIHSVRFVAGKLDIRLGPAFPGEGDTMVPARSTITLPRPFVYSGRILGRVSFSGTLPKDVSSPLDGLKVRLLKAGAVVQETYTDANGEFLFGNVLPGWYEVEIPAEGVPDDYAVEGVSRLTIEVPQDKPARPAFSLRRRSARERFGGGPR